MFHSKKLFGMLVLASALAGCSFESIPLLKKQKKEEPVVTVPSNPAEQAYLLGRDQGLAVLCAKEVPFTVLNEHKESVRMLLSTFTLEWQRAAQWEFNRGVQDMANVKRETLDCSGARAHLIEQIACNYEEAGKNLKRDTHFK